METFSSCVSLFYSVSGGWELVMAGALMWSNLQAYKETALCLRLRSELYNQLLPPAAAKMSRPKRQGELVKCYCWGDHYPTIGVVNSGKWHSLKDEAGIRRRQRWGWPLIHATSLYLSSFLLVSHIHKHTHIQFISSSLLSPLRTGTENNLFYVALQY